MALWLRNLLDMDQYRYMVFPAALRRLFIGLDQCRIVPSFDAVYHNAIGSLLHLHSAQRGGNGRFGGLVLFGNADAVPIVPNTHEHGHLKHSCRIHGFPKRTFRRARISNRTNRNFVPGLRKPWLQRSHVGQCPIQF